MFIGRGYELERLEAVWNTPGFQLPIVYGRRRVGKTALLEKFAENRKTLFFTPGRELNANIYSLKSLLASHGLSSSKNNIIDLISQVFDAATHERICFIIDEFPYLASSYPDIIPKLQHLIDKKSERSKLFLILCGSSISFMRESVMGYESPLYGRRTREFKIEPFPLHQCRAFLPYTHIKELCKIYGMTGGTPQYLKFMQDGIGFAANLVNGFLHPDSYLFTEAMGLLKQELHDPDLYGSLLEIVASGPIRSSEIADKMSREDVDQISCGNMIRNLVAIGILQGTSPIGGNIKKQTLFSIDDLFFRFWHRFMPHINFAVRSQRQDIAFDYINSHYSEYMDKVFEKISEQWLLRQNAERNLPIAIAQMGRWWGANPHNKNQEEIDIVARDFDGNFIFCECKWREQQVGSDVLKDLIRKSHLVAKEKNDRENCYYLFSKSGFSDHCVQEADKMPNCRLLTLDDL